MASVFDPPPTVNKLDQDQRMRLVRSNRKLEAVLGIMPHFVEMEGPDFIFPEHTSKAHRREGRVFGHSPSSSVSSSSSSSTSEGNIAVSYDPVRPRITPVTKTKQASRAKALSRPLLLRLLSVPVPHSDMRPNTLSPRLPSIAPVSPLSPTFSINLEKMQANPLDNRRRKIAKLTRTFGENIPVDLVFPSSVASTTASIGKPMKPRRRKPVPFPISSSSTDSLFPLRPARSASPTVPTPRPKSKSKSSTQSRSRSPSPSSSASPNHITPPPRRSSKNAMAAPTLAERRRRPRPRSLSLSAGTDMLIAAAAARVRADAGADADTNAQAASHPKAEKLTKPRTENNPTAPQVLSIHMNISSASANPIIHKAKQASLAFDEKTTRDVFNAPLSPPPFQAMLYQHRHSRSSPINIELDVVKHVPQYQHVHSTSHGHFNDTSRSASPPPKSSVDTALCKPAAFGRRKEREWSGEWNKKDMDEVVKGLRGLKAR